MNYMVLVRAYIPESGHYTPDIPWIKKCLSPLFSHVSRHRSIGKGSAVLPCMQWRMTTDRQTDGERHR